MAAAQIRAAQAALRDRHGPVVPVVVTHQVDITALTGIVPAAGEAGVVVPSGRGWKTIDRLAL